MLKKPNILVVLCDQLRRSALGCHGDPDARTPHLDAMASQGTTFTNACSTYPICVPFRFTMMTGQYAHTRVVPSIHWRMSPAEHTLADHFNAAGYHTSYIGKWHLGGGTGPHGFKQPVARPYRGAWKSWCGFELRNSHFDTVYFRDDDPTPIPIEGYQTDGLFDEAIDQLRQPPAGNDPFFMILSVEPPHPPYEAPPDLIDAWLSRDLHLPANFMLPGSYDPGSGPRGLPFAADQCEQVLRRRKIYYAMLENLDQNMGRLTHMLAQTGLDRNTIVIFLSDHGELGGAHALEEKQYPFEESCGIPLIAHGPGVARNHHVHVPASSEDLFPTLLTLGGISLEPSLPGSDLSGLMRGEVAHLDRPGVMLEFVHEHRSAFPFCHRGYRGFRSQRYKYTALVDGKTGKLTPWQFFDLQDDPLEMCNLIDQPEHVQEIRRHQQWLAERMRATADDLNLL